MHKCHICNKNIHTETNIPEQRGCHEHSDSGQLNAQLNLNFGGIPVADETPESERLLRVLLHRALERTSKIAIALFETNISVLWNNKEHQEDSDHNPSCWSLLALATWVGDVDHVRLLLTQPNACKVDAIVTKPDNLTALGVLARRSTHYTRKHEETRRVLMRQWWPRIPTGIPTRRGRPETKEGKAVIHLAAEIDDVDQLKLCMSRDKELYKLKTELEGDTALMVAVKANSLKCASVLVDTLKRCHPAYLEKVKNRVGIKDAMTALGIVFDLSYQSMDDMKARTEIRDMLLAHFVDRAYQVAIFDYDTWRSQCPGHNPMSLDMTILCILQYLTESISSNLKLHQRLQGTKPWCVLMKRFHEFNPDTQPVEMLCRLSYILVLMMQSSEEAVDHFLKKPALLRKIQSKVYDHAEDLKTKCLVVATILPLIYAVEHRQSFCDLYFKRSDARTIQNLNTLLKYQQLCLTSLLPRKLEQVEDLISAHLQTIVRKKQNMSIISCSENGKIFARVIAGHVPIRIGALSHTVSVSGSECQSVPEGSSGRVVFGPMTAEMYNEQNHRQTAKTSPDTNENQGRDKASEANVASSSVVAEVALEGTFVPEVHAHSTETPTHREQEREATTVAPKVINTFSDVTMPQQITEAQISADVEMVERLLSALTISGEGHDKDKRLWKPPKGVAQKCVTRKPISFKITKHSPINKSSIRRLNTHATGELFPSSRNSREGVKNAAVKHRKAAEANRHRSKKIASPKPGKKVNSMDQKTTMPISSDENNDYVVKIHRNIKKREHSSVETYRPVTVSSSTAEKETKLRGGLLDTAKSMWNRVQTYWSPAKQKKVIGGNCNASQHNKSSVRKSLAGEFEDAKSPGAESDATSEGVHFYWENLAVKYAAENIDAEEEYIADILETLTDVEVEAIAIAHEMDPEFTKDELLALAIAYKMAVRCTRSKPDSANVPNDAATLLTMDEVAELPDDDEVLPRNKSGSMQAKLTLREVKATAPQDITATVLTMDEVKAIPLPADSDTEETEGNEEATPQLIEEEIKAIPRPVETVSVLTMDEVKAIPLPAESDSEETEDKWATPQLTKEEIKTIPQREEITALKSDTEGTAKEKEATLLSDYTVTVPEMDEVKAIPLPEDSDTGDTEDEIEGTSQLKNMTAVLTIDDIEALPLPDIMATALSMDEVRALPLPNVMDTEDIKDTEAIPYIPDMWATALTMDEIRAIPLPDDTDNVVAKADNASIPQAEAPATEITIDEIEATAFLNATRREVDEIEETPSPDDLANEVKDVIQYDVTNNEGTTDATEGISLPGHKTTAIRNEAEKATPSRSSEVSTIPEHCTSDRTEARDVPKDQTASGISQSDHDEAVSQETDKGVVGLGEHKTSTRPTPEDIEDQDVAARVVGYERMVKTSGTGSTTSSVEVSSFAEGIAGSEKQDVQKGARQVESCVGETKLPHTGVSTNKVQIIPPGSGEAATKVPEKRGKIESSSVDSRQISQNALSDTCEHESVKDQEMTPSRTQSDKVFKEDTEEKTKGKHINRIPWTGSSGKVQGSDKGGMGDAQCWKTPHEDKDAATEKTFHAGLDLGTWPGHAFMAEDSLTYLARMQARVARSEGESFQAKVSLAVETERRGRTKQTRFSHGTDFRKIENDIQRQTICPEIGNPSACSTDCCCSEYKYLLATLGTRYGSHREQENRSSGCTHGRSFGSGDLARFWVEEGMVRSPQQYDQGDRMVDRSTQTSFELMNDLTEILCRDTGSTYEPSDSDSMLPEWILDTALVGPIETSSAMTQNGEFCRGVFKLPMAESPAYNATNSHMSEPLLFGGTWSAKKDEVTFPECQTEPSANQDFQSQKWFSETIKMASQGEQPQGHTPDEADLTTETDGTYANPLLNTTSESKEQPTVHTNLNLSEENSFSQKEPDQLQESQATADSQNDQQPPSPIESFQICNTDWLLRGNRWRSKLEVLQRLPVECRTVLGNRGGPFICPNIDFFVIGIGKRGGVTVLGSQQDTTPLAVTIIHPLRFNTEADQWMSCQALAITHKNLVKLMGIYFTHQAAFITSELYQGTLDQYLDLTNANGGLQLVQKLRMARDILAGLDYLHDRDILHKNLRPTKTFLASDGTVKLGHFGFDSENTVRKMELGILDSCCWQPVELLFFPSMVNYTKSSDVQVCGILLHFLFTSGQHPFGQVVFDIISNIMLGNVIPLTIMETNMTIIIGKMLMKIPQGRPTVKRVLNAAIRSYNCRKAPLQ